MSDIDLDAVKAAAERRQRIKACQETSQVIYGVVIDELKGRAGIIEAANKVKRLMIDDEELLADFAVALLTRPADFAELLAGEAKWERNDDVSAFDYWDSGVGRYEAWGPGFDDVHYRWDLNDEHSDDVKYASLEAAKSACRADFHARLRAMLRGIQVKGGSRE